MTSTKDKKQTALRITFGMGVIILVFLIEIFGLHPTGIYSYATTGYKSYTIGLKKDEVLRLINQNRSIRTMRACDPTKVYRLTSRKGFEFTDDLAQSDHWICYDKRGSDFLFIFKQNRLSRILIQRIRLGRKDPSLIFTRCNPIVVENVDTLLKNQYHYKVFYKN